MKLYIRHVSVRFFSGFQNDMPPPSSTTGNVENPRGNWTTKPNIGSAGSYFGKNLEAKKKPLLPVFDKGNPSVQGPMKKKGNCSTAAARRLVIEIG